jgi:hypothetical protein
MERQERFKLQSAIEYLNTYGWAIIIIFAVLLVFYELGVFNIYNMGFGAPPGACREYRPYGPNSTSYISLQGTCTNQIPQFIAKFNGQSSSVFMPNLFPSSECSMTITSWSYDIGMPSSIGGVVGGCSTNKCTSAVSSYPGGYAGIGYNDSTMVFIVGNATTNAMDVESGSFRERWVFTTFVLNDGIASTYINGILKSSFTNGVPTCISTTTWQIGNLTKMFDQATNFNGIISNIQVYNNSLTTNDIQALYTEGIGNRPIDLYTLVAWYTLNGNSYDYGGNYYNGSINNVGFIGDWYSTYTPVQGAIQTSGVVKVVSTSTSTSSTSMTSTSTSTTSFTSSSTSTTTSTLTSTSTTSTIITGVTYECSLWDVSLNCEAGYLDCTGQGIGCSTYGEVAQLPNASTWCKPGYTLSCDNGENGMTLPCNTILPAGHDWDIEGVDNFSNPCTPSLYSETLFALTESISPSGAYIGGVTPGTGNYATDMALQLSATPNPGWLFSGWTGTGPGNYTGLSPSPTIRMGGPVTEIANFVNSSSPGMCAPSNPVFNTFGSISGGTTQNAPQQTLVRDGIYGYLASTDGSTSGDTGGNWTWDFGAIKTGQFNVTWSSTDYGCASGTVTNFTTTWYASSDGSTWVQFAKAWGNYGPFVDKINGAYRYIRVEQYSNISGVTCPIAYTYVDSVCVNK